MTTIFSGPADAPTEQSALTITLPFPGVPQVGTVTLRLTTTNSVYCLEIRQSNNVLTCESGTFEGEDFGGVQLSAQMLLGYRYAAAGDLLSANVLARRDFVSEANAVVGIRFFRPGEKQVLLWTTRILKAEWVWDNSPFRAPEVQPS